MNAIPQDINAENTLDWQGKMSDAIELVHTLVRRGTNVMMRGPSGVGKTEMASTIADQLFPIEEEGTQNFCWFSTNSKRVDELNGMPAINIEELETDYMRPSALPVWKPGFPLKKKWAKRGILLLDEVNTTSDRQMYAGLLSLLNEGRIGDWFLAPGWVIIGTGNRKEDRASNTNEMGEAVDNRWGNIVVLPCIKAWSVHAAKKGCDPRLIAFLLNREEYLHKRPVDRSQHAWPSPRMWLKEVAKYMDEKPSLRLNIFWALVGRHAAQELEAFLRVFTKLPGIDKVIADPDNAPIPNDPDGRYAMVAMFSRNTTRQNFDKLMTYTRRLGEEFEMFYGTYMANADENMKKTKTYIDFEVRNQHLMVM